MAWERKWELIFLSVFKTLKNGGFRKRISPFPVVCGSDIIVTLAGIVTKQQGASFSMQD